MKTLLRLTASTALTLSMGAVAFGQHYVQTNLQSSVQGVAEETEPDLVNAWGITRTSASVWWVNSEKEGKALLFNGPGTKQSSPVSQVFIPPAVKNQQTPIGSPTGIVSNNSATDFLLAPGKPAVFIFATLDGTIAGWNPKFNAAPGEAPPSTHAFTVVKNTDGSIYRALTVGFINGNRFLYAANFGTGKVDVFDNAFHAVDVSKLQGSPTDDQAAIDVQTAPFTDSQLPAGFVPFGIQAIGDDIAVSYALHLEGQKAETDGPGNGYVDLFDTTGHLLTRFEHVDNLNTPWGMVLAPLDFGRFSHDLLVGQFAGAGDTEHSGEILAFDLATGKFKGALEDASGKTLVINGIWGLSPGNVAPASVDPDDEPAAQIYFTAGPNKSTQGLFGYLTAVSKELVEGSVQ